MTKLIEVEFNIGPFAHRHLGLSAKTYTYTAPESADIEVGDEVIVPVTRKVGYNERQSELRATVVAVSDLNYKQIIAKVVRI